jgi:predicted CXXCH cytochrome family protein
LEEMKGRRKHGPFKIGMCDGCHYSHQSTNPKLLIGAMPQLCFHCHSEKGFIEKNVHKPVLDGECFYCHGIHSTRFGRLLKHKGDAVCKRCHESVFEKPHPLTGFPEAEKRMKSKKKLASRLFGDAISYKSHPVKGKDPKRTGRRFGCTSCHSPHSSDSPVLFRYKASDPRDLCKYCHEKEK